MTKRKFSGELSEKRWITHIGELCDVTNILADLVGNGRQFIPMYIHVGNTVHEFRLEKGAKLQLEFNDEDII